MRPLPYRHVAVLRDQDGTEVESIPCTIWPTMRSTSGAGEYYDYEAEAPSRFYELLTETNRHLRMAEVNYHIIETIRHTIFPHVTLRLRRRGG